MPLTIGMFSDTYTPEINGVVTSVASTARALRRRGHRVIIVAPAHDRTPDDDPDVFRFRSTPFPFYPQLRMAFPLPAKLLASLPRMPFDVIHAHSFFFVGCLGAYLAQLRRIALFFTYHTRWTEYTHYLPLNKRITHAQAVWLSREFCNRCDGIVAPTHSIAEILRSYGVARRIDVIPTGVDLDLFGTPGPLEEDTPRAPALLYAGRLGKEKNLDFLLDAFALLAQRVPAATLTIVGSGPHEHELRAHVRALPGNPRVEFTGALQPDALGRRYRSANAFAFTSKTETQGLVVIEAMAHGLPVVALESPIMREILPPAAGVIVAEDVQTFADAAAALLAQSAAQRRERGAAARVAAAPYAIDAVAARLERLYQTGRASPNDAGIAGGVGEA
jgi:glycosyltransferase involved in cell wall biosynthesis